MSDGEEDLLRATIRGISRTLIIWLVSQQPMSGYRIVKEMSRLTDQNVKSGTIYPLLYELEDKGLIRGSWVQKGRRRIKYYSATERGRMVLNRICKLFETPLREFLVDLLGEEPPTTDGGSVTYKPQTPDPTAPSQ